MFNQPTGVLTMPFETANTTVISKLLCNALPMISPAQSRQLAAGSGKPFATLAAGHIKQADDSDLHHLLSAVLQEVADRSNIEVDDLLAQLIASTK
jgi:hypothetical protein